MPQICSGGNSKHSAASGNKRKWCHAFFSPHMWAGSQEHLLVSYEQTFIQAALFSLMPFNNISWLEGSFSPLISITINYYHHIAVQASSNAQAGTESPNQSNTSVHHTHTHTHTHARTRTRDKTIPAQQCTHPPWYMHETPWGPCESTY